MRYYSLIFLILLLLSCSKADDSHKNTIDEIATRIDYYFIDAEKRLNGLYDKVKILINENQDNTDTEYKSKFLKKFRLFDNSIYYNPKRGDECSYWYRDLEKKTNPLETILNYGKFEEYIKKTSRGKVYNNYVFLLSVDNVIISYPYINFMVYLKPQTNFKKILLKYPKTVYDNSYKKKWNEVYLDVMGMGYVTSYNKFILENSRIKYQISIDISIPSLYKKTIKNINKPMMIASTSNYLIAVNNSCRSIFNINGCEKKFYLEDVSLLSIKKIRILKHSIINKKHNQVLYKMFIDIKNHKTVNISYKGVNYRVYKRVIKSIGWYLFEFERI